MSKRISKRYKKLLEIFKEKKVSTLEEAVKKVKQSCTSKFNESIDVSLNLNLKNKKEEINLRTVVNLPNGNGKKMMPKMGKIGKILGPKGLMPNPKLGTVTNDIKKTVKMLKEGQVEIKNDKDGNVGLSIGKKNFDDKKIIENFNALIQTIQKEKPNGIKGDFILSSFLTSSMGISHKIKLKV